jgi:hypothetical protein
MLRRTLIGAVALSAALALITAAGAQAQTDGKYPDWKGQWIRAGEGQGATWDPATPRGQVERAPLTAEYQAKYEENLREQANGQQGDDPSYRCIPAGMPRIMIAVQPMEIVITPDTTYVMIELFSTLRRIFTDGRAWPQEFEPSFSGYSIGHWEDTDGDGKYDTLVAETRRIKGPHTYDSTGLPFHDDAETIVKERISLDKGNPNLLTNEITTIDHALTQPWTVKRTYRRSGGKQPVWSEYYCQEDNHHVQIGNQNYIISGDGHLMPVRKGQPAPDLKYFDK